MGSANTANVAAIENSLEEILGERLISAGRIDARSLDRATRLRAESGDRIDHVLTKLGMVTERDMAEALSTVLGLSLASPDDYPDHRVLEAEVSARFLRESCIMPLAETDDAIALAMADPLDSYAIKAMELNAGKMIQPWVGAAAESNPQSTGSMAMAARLWAILSRISMTTGLRSTARPRMISNG